MVVQFADPSDVDLPADHLADVPPDRRQLVGFGTTQGWVRTQRTTRKSFVGSCLLRSRRPHRRLGCSRGCSKCSLTRKRSALPRQHGEALQVQLGILSQPEKCYLMEQDIS